VFQLLINAQQVHQLVFALHAIKVMTFKTEFVSILYQTQSNQLTLDVEHGTGTTKSVFPAPKIGSSTPTKPASPFLINAQQVIALVTV
jgi:hypothetical protein